MERVDADLVPFAQNNPSGYRFAFGTDTATDDINVNYNDNIKKGWGTTPNEFPEVEDFNAFAYTSGYLTAYLYQMGISEWNDKQKYKKYSRVIGSNGKIYKAKTGTDLSPNINNNPITDTTNWEDVLSNFVSKAGAETIAGVKTFSSSPIVPTPTAITQAVNKAYVDNKPSGFKNLIINGAKKVNQSGLTTTDNSYNYDNHYKVGNNWFIFVSGKNIISGESYTLSWDGAATAGYYIGTAGATTINAQTFTSIANGKTIIPTITSNQKLWIKFASDASGSTYSKVQLEPGTVPTPFEHRLYELEESLVQRVYEHGIISTLALSANTAYKGGINNAYFKTTKDIVPQIVITTNNGSKSAQVWAVNKDVVQFSPTVQASADDFINVVANIDARPY